MLYKKALLYTSLIVLLAGSVGQGAAPEASAQTTVYDGTSREEREKALEAVNRLRLRMGLAEAELDPALNRAAEDHARYANAHFEPQSAVDFSVQEEGREFYTQSTPEARAEAAGFRGEGRKIMETVYVKERAYDMFDMTEEIRELTFVHDRREAMLTPAATALGIARVGKATVIVGAADPERAGAVPATASVYPYEGATDVWPGYFHKADPYSVDGNEGEGTTISVYSTLPDVSDAHATLTTMAGDRTIDIPLAIRKTESGYGYSLTALQQLRGDREYTAEVSFRSGGERLQKRWTFRTSDFQHRLNLNDMPLVLAPALHRANGRFEAPMRYLFELFGAEVQWNAAEQRITAAKGELTLEMTIGDDTAYVGGRAVPLDSPPRLDVYTTYVPLRFVAETFGFQVEYDATNDTVDLWLEPVAKDR